MRLAATLLILTLVSVAACSRSSDVTPLPAAAPGTPHGPVTIEFAHGETRRTVQIESVPEGTTVEQVMRSIEEVPIEIRGRGTTAFVDRIDGVATGADTGWTYQINGEHVHRGIGATELSPPATIRWTFGDWDDTESDNAAAQSP